MTRDFRNDGLGMSPELRALTAHPKLPRSNVLILDPREHACDCFLSFQFTVATWGHGWQKVLLQIADENNT